MRVALITLASEQVSCSFIQPHLGVEHMGINILGAVLRRAGHVVKIIDGVALSLNATDVIRLIEAFEAEVVGLSPTLACMPETLTVARALKVGRHPPWVLIGGHHATLCGREILTHERDIDMVLLGDAELSLPGLLNEIARGHGAYSVPGVLFRMGGAVFGSPQSKSPPCLDEIPFAARDTLDGLTSRYELVSANIASSRGCPYQCSFCSTPTFYAETERYRRRSVNKLFDEIETLQSSFGVRLINFTDDIFLIPNVSTRRWVEEFAAEKQRRGLSFKFSAMFRAEMFKPKNVQMVKVLVDAGLHHVLVGMENSNPEALEFMSKGTNLDDYRLAINFLREHRVFLAAAFIAFEPHTTLEQVKSNVRYLGRVVRDPVFYHYVSHLTVFPGTPAAATLQSEGLIDASTRSYLMGLSYSLADERANTISLALREIAMQPITGDTHIEYCRYTLSHVAASGMITESQRAEAFDQLTAASDSWARAHEALLTRLIAHVESGAYLLLTEVETYVERYATEASSYRSIFLDQLRRASTAGSSAPPNVRSIAPCLATAA